MILQRKQSCNSLSVFQVVIQRVVVLYETQQLPDEWVYLPLPGGRHTHMHAHAHTAVLLSPRTILMVVDFSLSHTPTPNKKILKSLKRLWYTFFFIKRIGSLNKFLVFNSNFFVRPGISAATNFFLLSFLFLCVSVLPFTTKKYRESQGLILPYCYVCIPRQ